MRRNFLFTLAILLAGSPALSQDPYVRPSLDSREALANDDGVIPQPYLALTNAQCRQCP